MRPGAKVPNERIHGELLDSFDEEPELEGYENANNLRSDL
jgi:hypothetical protein